MQVKPSRLGRFVQGAALLMLIGLLFMATAAPGGGGGGGGGYGGGGGFGGGGSGYGSRSYDSYQGYNSTSPYDSQRHGYGGDPLSRAPLWIPLVIIFAGLAIAGLMFVGGRHRVVHLLLNLRQAERYAPALDGVLAAADFETPAGRAATLGQLARLVSPSDLVDGRVEVRGFGPLGPEGEAADGARALYREKMGRAGLREGTPALLGTPSDTTPRVRPGDGCVLGLVFVVSARSRFCAGGTPAAIAALGELRATRYGVPAFPLPAPVAALYCYYAPDPGQPLDPDAARQLFYALGREAAV
jgi:hypothetical protein